VSVDKSCLVISGHSSVYACLGKSIFVFLRKREREWESIFVSTHKLT